MQYASHFGGEITDGKDTVLQGTHTRKDAIEDQILAESVWEEGSQGGLNNFL